VVDWFAGEVTGRSGGQSGTDQRTCFTIESLHFFEAGNTQLLSNIFSVGP